MAKKKEATAPEAAPMKVEIQIEVPHYRTVVLKGHGLLHGGVNGVPFELQRGKPVEVTEAIYQRLLAADEIA